MHAADLTENKRIRYKVFISGARNTTLFIQLWIMVEGGIMLSRISTQTATRDKRSIESPKSGISECIALTTILYPEDIEILRTNPLIDWLGELDLQRGRGGLSIMQAS